MNSEEHLPAVVLIIPDKDLLAKLPTYGFGVKQILRKELTWLINKIERAIEARRENLKKLRPGAVLPMDTIVMWMKMVARPLSTDQDLIKILKLRRKFNETLEDLLCGHDNMKIILLSSVTEGVFFTTSSDLSKSGKTQFWAEINHQIKNFEY